MNEFLYIVSAKKLYLYFCYFAEEVLLCLDFNFDISFIKRIILFFEYHLQYMLSPFFCSITTFTKNVSYNFPMRILKLNHSGYTGCGVYYSYIMKSVTGCQKQCYFISNSQVNIVNGAFYIKVLVLYA